MDVRRAAGIGDRLQRPEAIAPFGIDQHAAVALERRIAPLATRLPRMIVEAQRIALPDLDQRTGHRPATGIQHATLQMQHRAHRLRCLAAHLDEVVVDVDGKADGIERPFGLLTASMASVAAKAREGPRAVRHRCPRAGCGGRSVGSCPAVYKQKRRPEWPPFSLPDLNLTRRPPGRPAASRACSRCPRRSPGRPPSSRGGPCRDRRRPGP